MVLLMVEDANSLIVEVASVTRSTDLSGHCLQKQKAAD